MGFLSKAFKRVKKQIQPSIGSIRTPDNFVAPRAMDEDRMIRGPGLNPRKKIMDPGMIGDMRFRGRLPQKNTTFSKAIRRLKEQIRNQQPIPERMPIDPSSYYNPTIFGQPIGDMDFSQMPKVSPEDMMNLQIPTEAPVMPMTQDLPEVAPVGMMPQMRMGGMQDMEPRMMMAGGDEAVTGLMAAGSTGSDTYIEKQSPDMLALVEMARNAETPEEVQEIFKLMDQLREMEGRPQLADGGDFPDLTGDGKVTQADILKGRGVYAEGDEVRSFADYQPEGSLKGTFFDYIPDGYQVSSFLMDKFGQEAAQDPTIREMFEKEFKAARMAGKDVFEFMGKPYNTKTLEEVEGMRYGGEMERFQDGGEIDAMLSGMSSEETGAMEDLEQMAPEMEMIDQLVTMVVQMIQQGASEEEVMMFLREQGLDDEDIGTVLQLVAEMAEAEAMPQDGIGAELEQLA